MDIQNTRVSLSVLAVVVASTASAGITWGVYSTRMAQIEREQSEQRKEVRKHEVVLTRVEVQYTEIIRRLGNIESAIKADQ